MYMEDARFKEKKEKDSKYETNKTCLRTQMQPISPCGTCDFQ